MENILTMRWSNDFIRHLPYNETWLIDLLISNNFSSMTFFCATRILRVTGRQSKRQSTDFFTDFLAEYKKQVK